jgi:hypothetical protein
MAQEDKGTGEGKDKSDKTGSDEHSSDNKGNKPESPVKPAPSDRPKP